MTYEQTEPWPAGISTRDMPLPQRWYKYRDKILRYRQMGHAGNQAYWAIEGLPDLARAHWTRVRAASDSINASVENGGILSFDSVDFDTDNYAPAGIPLFDAITIPVSLGGVYTVVATSSGTGTQSTTLGMGILVNGTTHLSETNKAISGPSSVNYTLDNRVAQILRFAEGDTIQLKNNSVSPGPNAFASTFLALAWLGA